MPKRKQIAHADFDSAYYIGSERAGIYFDAAKGRDGWYVTTAYDIGHDAGDMTVDDGPYPTERDALLAGLDHGIGWCITNNVRWMRQKYQLEKRIDEDTTPAPRRCMMCGAVEGKKHHDPGYTDRIVTIHWSRKHQRNQCMICQAGMRQLDKSKRS